jgi:two-component system osmolarity sensor histidine kinase EnvZ
MFGQVRRLLNRVMPRTLFGRSLLIVVLPLLLLQLVLTYMFYNRHWDTVTRWLASGVAGEVALLVELLDEAPNPKAEARLLDRMRRHTELAISFEPGGRLEDAVETAGIETGAVSHIDSKILEAFEEKLTRPFAVDLRPDQPQRVAVYVQLDDGLLRVLAPKKRITSTTAWLLLAWMVGASVFLLAVALYFLRLQLRPIRRLARAADSFGKGRDVGDVRPQGALEIRQAAHVFNLMRHRILRHISQRTEMLAAVSHDLRTPLTRMKLELELLRANEDPVLAGLKQDVEEMARLVEEYLGFARDEGREATAATELAPILESMQQRAERSGVVLEIAMDAPIVLPLRPTAFRRCLGNLVDNACRYARWIGISARRKDEMVEIAVEDDGPGIPAAWREKVFEPFVRLDEGRGGDDGGTGLGLTIARDVVLAHGGDLRLDQSPRGGLKALLRLPA